MSAVVLASAAASAQSKPDPVAEALFLEGRALLARGETSAACEKFAASDRVAPSVGARINLGDCYRLEGKSASAWATYRAAAGLAQTVGDDRRLALIESLVAEAEADLVYVLIHVDAGDKRRIALDGEAQPAAVLGRPVPVDPGTHVITATGSRGQWRREVQIAPGDETIEIRVEPPRQRQPLPPEPEDGGLGTRKKLAIAAASSGAVALVVGAGFGISTIETWDRARRDHCNAELSCDDEGIALSDRARRHGTISTAAFVTAGIALGTATILWLTGDAEPERSGGSVAPLASPGAAGLSWSGRF